MAFKLLKNGRARVLTRRNGRAALVAAAICVATAPSPSYAAAPVGGERGREDGGRRGRAVQAHRRPAREAQEGRPGARAGGVKREA